MELEGADYVNTDCLIYVYNIQQTGLSYKNQNYFEYSVKLNEFA